MAAFSLESLDDEALEGITGQAAVKLSTDSRDTTSGTIDFTRVEMGLYTETFLGIDDVKLGTYARDGETGSDIDIENLGLGYIDQTGDTDPNNDYIFNSRRQEWVLADTDPLNDRMVPFKIQDPYFEFAYQEGELIGFRMGFGEAKGALSGDITSLSGNIDAKISGTVSEIEDDLTGLGDFALFLGLIDPDDYVEATAKLIDADRNSDTYGEIVEVRGTHIGIENGRGGVDETGGGLIAAIPAEGCDLSGVQACFPISLYQSMVLGNPALTDPEGGINGGAEGVFISVQNDLIPWPDLVNPGQSVTLQSGAGINLPVYLDDAGNAQYPVNTSFEQALNGIPRLLTCYGNGSC